MNKAISQRQKNYLKITQKSLKNDWYITKKGSTIKEKQKHIEVT